MTEKQYDKLRFIAKDYYLRAIYHRVPRAYFVMQCVVTGMLIAWEVSEKDSFYVDRIMESIKKFADRMTSQEIAEYAATRESEWKYWKHD